MSKHIQVTDDWRADEPMGYAVPTPNSDLGEYRVFELLHDAKHFADRQEDDEGADIPIYPLWAGHPIDHSRDQFDEYSFEQPSEQSHAALQTEVAGLRAIIQGALRIESLWLPAVVSKEHENEAIALHAMRDSFLAAVSTNQENQS